MDGPRRYYPKKLFKSGKDKYYMIPFICGILKKKKPASTIKQKLSFPYREQTDGCQREGIEVEGKKQVRIMKRYKLQLGSK